jgi:hypothetical protein
MLYLIFLAVYLAGWAIAAFSAMITVGILHNWWSFIPPMGFGTAFALVALPLLISVVSALVKDQANKR